MKKKTLPIISLLSLFFSFPAVAQTRMEGGVSQDYRSQDQNTVKPPRLKRWGLQGGVSIEGDFVLGAFSISGMFNKYFGLQGSLASDFSSTYDYPVDILTRSSLSALWYVGGISPNQMNFYLKGGIAYQSLERINSERDGDRLELDSAITLQLGAGIEVRFLNGWLGMGMEGVFILPSWQESGEGNDEMHKGSFMLNLYMSFYCEWPVFLVAPLGVL